MHLPTIQPRLWPWLRAAIALATLLLLALVLAPGDYGRYVTAVAVASCLAPLLVGGPAFVYLQSHRDFGCPRDQLATVWTRALLVLGPLLALVVPIAMYALAGERDGLGLWFAVGVAEIVLAGFVEMIGRHHDADGDGNAMAWWQAAPYALRLVAVVGFLAFGAHVALPTWVSIAFASSMLVVLAGFHAVKRREAPRSVDVLVRLVRIGFHYSLGGVGNRGIADGDKPFLARMIDPSIAGAVFIAQRVVDFAALPLHAAVANARTRAFWLPVAYAIAIGAVLALGAPLLRAVDPRFATTATALAWLCWLPMLEFARGMVGNAAVRAGRGEVYARGLGIAAMVRIVLAIVLIGFMGWPGAIASLFVAEVVPIAIVLAGRKPLALRGASLD